MPVEERENIYSAETNEIMKSIPGRLVRWGMSLFFLFLIILFVGGILFKSPGKVTIPVIITSDNPPAIIKAVKGGNIEILVPDESSEVREGEIIAVIENRAKTEDINALTGIIESIEYFDWDSLVYADVLPANPSLGEVQGSYISFQKEFDRFRYYIEQGFLEHQIRLLERQLVKQDEYQGKLSEQYEFQKDELDLAIKGFERDSLLYSGGYITVPEYEQSKRDIVQKKSAFKGFEASLINNELGRLRLEESIIQMKMQLEQEKMQFRINLDEKLKVLKSAIDQWEEQYVLKSPADGIVTYTRYWSNNQSVNAGDIIATVVPYEIGSIIGKAYIPVSEIGKVKEGLNVSISLPGYPYMKYGKLSGIIKSISLVPDKEGYVANISLPEGMKTTYGRELDFIQEISGTAEIITEERSILFGFIEPLKSRLKND